MQAIALGVQVHPRPFRQTIRPETCRVDDDFAVDKLRVLAPHPAHAARAESPAPGARLQGNPVVMEQKRGAMGFGVGQKRERKTQRIDDAALG